MRIINKKYLLIILLIVVIITGVIVMKPKEEVKLDNVILKQEVNNKTFAMYKEDGENNYVKVEDNKFPNMYVLNIKKSKCIDNNGNELNGVLSYENDKVTITSGNTTYCYLYFDKSLGLEIKEKNPSGLKAEKVRGAMYRFQGQYNENVQNYICFGTSDKEECIADQDKHMYRIIGIEAETGRVKVIKKEALDKTYQWYSDYNADVKLPDSVFFNAINGADFLNNQEYIPTGWKYKISDNTWIYGDMWEDSDIGAKQLGAGLYDTESGNKSTIWYVKSILDDGETSYKRESRNWNDKVESKISLMYLHDYSYSVGDEAKCNYYFGGTEYSKCKLGWIHLSNNDTDASNKRELVMTRNGWDMNLKAYYGFYVNEVGYTGTGDARLDNATHIVRPVFYLASVNELVGGTGTITNPFIIS